MRIPVFVSCPTALNKKQEESRKIIDQMLDILHLEPRALGRSDYPTEYPLKEVYVIANHCSGGIILGFEQFYTEHGVWKRDTEEQRKQEKPVSFPTPWNNIEAGILFSLKRPILIFKDEGITGGVFDEGVTDVFVHKMPSSEISKKQGEYDALQAVFLKWHAKVINHYYKF